MVSPDGGIIDLARRKNGSIYIMVALLLLFPTANITTASIDQSNRSLGFYNLHTKEHLKLDYWVDGEFQQQNIALFNELLRDYRRNEVITMDPVLFDVLYALKRKVGSHEEFHVISAYRSPKTNAQLAAQGRKVASKSMHMLGQAIDIRLPDISLNQLHQAAVELKAGGVGFYREDNFIHVDTGRVRYW